MSIFDDLDGAKVYQRGAYFPPGRYIVQIEELSERSGENATRDHGDMFFVNSKMVLVLDTNGNPTPPRQGERMGTAAKNIGPAKPMFLPNIRRWLTELSKSVEPAFDPNQLTKEDWNQLGERATGKEQLLSGQFVEVLAHQTKKKNGEPFTVVNYTRGYTPRQLRDVFAALGVKEDTIFPGGELDRLIAEQDAFAAAPQTQNAQAGAPAA